MNKSYIEESKHYINYRLGNENFAIPVERIVEIIQPRILTKIPNSSQFILGVINFRGEILPVIDFHRRFNMIKEENQEGMIMVVKAGSDKGGDLIGLMVDNVEDVFELNFKNIQKSIETGINYDINFIDGVANIDQKFIMILNIDRVLNKTELSEVSII